MRSPSSSGSRIRRGTSHPPGLLAEELAPFALILTALWVKLSYFSFPSLTRIANDWGGWDFLESVQAVLGSLSTLLVLCAPLLLLAPARRLVALLLLDAIVTAVVVANVLHFRFYGDVLSVSALTAAGQLGYVSRSIAALLKPGDILFLVDLGIATHLMLRRTPWPASDPVRNRALAVRVAGAGLVLLAALPVRIVAVDPSETFHNGYFRFFGVREIGLLNYHAYETGLRLSRRIRVRGVSDEERERVRAFIREWRDASPPPSELFGAARGKSLIMIMVESLQAFPMELRIDGQEVTPNLNALAGRSLFFENFFDQTWEGTTSDGEFTSLQSLHPLPAGAVPTTYPNHDYRGIPEVLAERGYQSFSAHAYWGDLWNMREMHPRLGFQQSYFLEAYELTEEIGSTLADREFFLQTLPRLEAQTGPFMAYLMTISTHHPYELPEGYRTLRLGELEGTKLGDYLHSVHYLDAALGELLDRLERSGVLERSVLVVYGDHKARFDDPERLPELLMRHAGYPARSEGLDPLYWRAEHRLPLIIHLPGDSVRGVRTAPAGHLDIAPTVLGLLGVDDHGMPSLGRDLTREGRPLVVLRTGGFIAGDTLCVTTDGTRAGARCRSMRTLEELDPSRLLGLFAEARAHLEVSDIIVRGDMIGELQEPAPGSR